MREALVKYGKPEIKNSHHGSQFTGFEWTNVLKDAGGKNSMDGRGRWGDNRMIERLWRTLECHSVSLRPFETGSQARATIGEWEANYNAERRPSTHGIVTLNVADDTKTEPMRTAAQVKP